MSVGFERRRDKLGIYFDLPGWPDRIKQGLGVKYTEEAREDFERKLGRQVENWIGGARWPELLTRFPDNLKLRSALASKVGGTELTMGKMLDDLVKYWERKGRRQIPKMVSKLNHLRDFFGAECYVSEVTDLRVEAFVTHMLKAGYEGATINRCLSHFKTAFRKIAAKHGVDHVPVMEMQAEAPPREDFFKRFEIDRLVAELPEQTEKSATMVGFFTGWRLDAVLSRRINDFDDEFLYLDEGHSKNKKPLLFPLNSFPELKPLLERQVAYVHELELKLGRIIPWLFPNPKTGERLKSFYDSWRAAVERAGLHIDPTTQKRLVHSVTGKPIERYYHGLRRTATGNLEDLGLSERQTMDLVGHQTPSMHARYRRLADKSKVRDYGAKIAAAVAAQEPSNVVPIRAAVGDFVQHTSNGAVSEGGNESDISSAARQAQQNRAVLVPGAGLEPARTSRSRGF